MATPPAGGVTPYFIRLPVLDGQGRAAEVEFKAWVHDDGVVLFELRRVAESIDGVPLGGLQLKEWLRNHKKALSSRFASASVDWEEEVTRSRLAFMAVNRERHRTAQPPLPVPRHMHDEFTITMKGCCLFVLCAALDFRKVLQRSRATTVFRALLSKLMPPTPTTASDLDASFGPGLFESCQVGTRQGQRFCSHMSEAVADLHSTTAGSQLAMADFVFHLASYSHACAAAKRAFAGVLVQISDIMGEAVPEVAFTSDASKATQPTPTPNKRRRRADEDLKQEALRAVSAGKAASPQAFLRAATPTHPGNAPRWIEESCARHMTCAWSAFSSSRTLSVSIDGCRVGQPAKEFEVAFAFDPEGFFGAWLPPQELPDFMKDRPRGRQQTLSREELAEEMERLRCFIEWHEEVDGKTGDTEVKQSKAQSIANQYYLQALDHALAGGAGRPLADFVAQGGPAPLGRDEERYWLGSEDFEDAGMDDEGIAGRRRSCIENMVIGERRVESPLVYDDDGELVRPTLHLVSDDGPIGLPAMVYLFGSCKIRGTRRVDPWHRIWRFTQRALKTTGLWPTVLDWTICFNVVHGPWMGDGFFGQLVGAARAYFASATWRCPLFGIFYEQLCASYGDVRSSFATKSHMQETFERLKRSRVLQAKGAHVKLGRWFSYAKVAEEKGPQMVELAIFLCYLGIREGWWTKEANPLFMSDFCPSVADAQAGPEQQPAVPGPSAGAAPQALRQSNAEVEKRTEKCKNQLDLVFRLVSSPMSRRRMHITRLILGPLNEFFGTWQTACKTVRGNKETHIKWATGESPTECMWRTASLVNDPSAMAILEFRQGNSLFLEEDIAMDNDIADLFFLGICGILGEIAQWAMSFTSFLPGSFYLLLHHEAAMRSRGLEFCRRIWDLLDVMEKDALDDLWKASLLNDLQFPSWVWVREQLISMAECGFDSIPASCRDALEAWAHGINTTNMNEDAFHVIKEAARESSSKRCGNINQWHSLISADLAKNYDRKYSTEQGTASTARLPNKSLPKSMFKSDADNFSLGMDVLHDLALAPTSVAPWRVATMPMLLKAMFEHSESDNLDMVWLSQLAEIKTMMVQKSARSTGMLTIHVNRWGMLMWPLRRVCDNGPFELVPPTAEQPVPWVWGSIVDIKQWRAAPMKLVAHTGNRASTSTKLTLTMERRPEDIMVLAARRAFTPMTVPDMQKLLTIANVQVESGKPRPRTEKDLTVCLVKHCLPDLSDQQLATILAFRFSEKQVTSILFKDDNLDNVRDLLDSHDLPEYEKKRKKHQTASKGESKSKPVGSASSSSAPASAASSSRPKVSLRGSSTPEALKEWLPRVTGCTATLDTARHMRWVMKYPRTEAPTHVSKAFADESAITQRQAYLFCLRQVWAWHTEATSEVCPWDLSE